MTDSSNIQPVSASEKPEYRPQSIVPEQPIYCQNFTTPDGTPDGGIAYGQGFTISWQRGPINLPDGTTRPRNGAFMMEVLTACLRQIEFYGTHVTDAPNASNKDSDISYTSLRVGVGFSATPGIPSDIN